MFYNLIYSITLSYNLHDNCISDTDIKQYTDNLVKIVITKDTLDLQFDEKFAIDKIQLKKEHVEMLYSNSYVLLDHKNIKFMRSKLHPQKVFLNYKNNLLKTVEGYYVCYSKVYKIYLMSNNNNFTYENIFDGVNNGVFKLCPVENDFEYFDFESRDEFFNEIDRCFEYKKEVAVVDKVKDLAFVYKILILVFVVILGIVILSITLYVVIKKLIIKFRNRKNRKTFEDYAFL